MKKLLAVFISSIFFVYIFLSLGSNNSFSAQASGFSKKLHSPGTCLVTSPNDSGFGSFRECMENVVSGDEITFDPLIFPPNNPVTITLASELPAIISDSITINASNSGVILNGSNLLDGNGSGFLIDGANYVHIMGLIIVNFPHNGILITNGASYNEIGGSNASPGGSCSGECNLIHSNGTESGDAGIRIFGSGTMSNTVTGNYIGTDLQGSSAFGNYDGVRVVGGASQNTIGGVSASERNIISSNKKAGIAINGLDTDTNTNYVIGNYIGTDASGLNSLGNGVIEVVAGVAVHYSGNNTIEKNIISGNIGSGITIQGNTSQYNIVSGNYIGTNYLGTSKLLNTDQGISIREGASYNIVGGNNSTPGGSCSGDCNLISGNGDQSGDAGIRIAESGTMSNTISGNFIGTDIQGTSALGNYEGIYFDDGTSKNIIGGDIASERNIISGNNLDGVFIRGNVLETHFNYVIGNYIGTDTSGQYALGNGGGVDGFGIFIRASDNVIENNLISGNNGPGIGIAGSETYTSTGNLIKDNYLGTDANGLIILGNTDSGIFLTNASDNIIEDNLLSGNIGVGIDLWGERVTRNIIRGNFIGTNLSGLNDLGNFRGIDISSGAHHNLIGGSNDSPSGACSGDCNLISGNTKHGILISDSGTISNTISGNYIGTDVNGTLDLGNSQSGILLNFGAQNNIIGGTTDDSRNIISANNGNGIMIINSNTTNNQIRGNKIGTDSSGENSLPNEYDGIFIGSGASNNTIGGISTSYGNLIAHNKGTGVYLHYNESISNTISHNSIYSNTNQGIALVDGANNSMFPPLITTVSLTQVKGISIPDGFIEVFSDEDDEGRWFEGSTTADSSGYFTFTAASPFTGTNITATATDSSGNTSEFSSAFTPSRDLLPVLIYTPQSRHQINTPLTPFARVGNAGTASESFTVTMVITFSGSIIYQNEQLVINLAPLSYKALSFSSWTPSVLGDYEAMLLVQPDQPDDNPTNDYLYHSFSVVDDRVDVWSRDNLSDDGTEPSSGSPWQSPDLWVRNNDDDIYIPQNPINNITNTVYILVRNRGTLTSTNTTVDLYWHPPALVIGQSWWQPIITTTIGEIAPSEIFTAEIDWRPQITDVLTVPYHTCLLALIKSDEDSTPDWWDVRGSNNIIQRNVDIIQQTTNSASLMATTSSKASSTFNLGNPFTSEQLVDIAIDTTNLPTSSEMRLNLGELFERWNNFGNGSLSDAYVIEGADQIAISSGVQALIHGMPLKGEELIDIGFEVFGLNGEQGLIHVAEFIGGELMGGISLQISQGYFIYIPIIYRN